MRPKVFIDGEAGTTGLEIRDRLGSRTDIELLSIDPALRKQETARRAAFEAADAAILCLPDDAAKKAAVMAHGAGARVIDASSAHRVDPDWVYGFPEMAKGQRAVIAKADRISNPGCYAIAAIALLKPLVEANLVAADAALSLNAVSGYSGGGRAMIEEFEAGVCKAASAHHIYGLALEHKHVPEIMRWAGLERRPLFAPSVGRYRKGMILEAPLQFEPPGPSAPDIHRCLERRYLGEQFVSVVPLRRSEGMERLQPEGLNGSNQMELYVFTSKDGRQIRLVARLDNLGKGAAGQAVQNLNLMLGLGEAAGLGEDSQLQVLGV